MIHKEKVRVLFICMGNICRSPTAEGVFTHLVESEGLGDKFLIDSAGTHAYHVNKPPDQRAQSAARARGIDISGLRARQVDHSDFTEFDYLLVMDRENYDTLRYVCPKSHLQKLSLLLDYAPDQPIREVPDPYYGGAQGFEVVLDLVEAACQGLLARLKEDGYLTKRKAEG